MPWYTAQIGLDLEVASRLSRVRRAAREVLVLVRAKTAGEACLRANATGSRCSRVRAPVARPSGRSPWQHAPRKAAAHRSAVLEPRPRVEHDDALARRNPAAAPELDRGSPRGAAFGADIDAGPRRELPRCVRDLRLAHGDRRAPPSGVGVQVCLKRRRSLGPERRRVPRHEGRRPQDTRRKS